MKLYFLILLSFLLFSCENHRLIREKKANQAELDSLDITHSNNDSSSESREVIIEQRVNDVILKSDTTGSGNAPLKIISYKVVKSETGRYRNIKMEYKNISSKKIVAFKVGWFGKTAFGDPAEAGGSIRLGFGGGVTETNLNPKGQDEVTWEVLSKNLKTIVAIWPTEIAFSDGTKWKNKN